VDLIRLDSNPNPDPDEYPDEHRQNEYRINNLQDDIIPEDSKLRVVFSRFGRGEQRRPSFAVEVNWIDVRSFVREFIEMKHPEAIHLGRMIRLAEKIEEAGWSANEPAPEEFWEIVPT
jgi:hypothetical protein